MSTPNEPPMEPSDAAPPPPAEAPAGPPPEAPGPVAKTGSTPAGPNLLHALAEHFLLRDAEAAARVLSDETRAALARALARSAQKRAAARTLWEAGSKAEAVSLGVSAFEVVAAADGAAGSTVARQLEDVRKLLDERTAAAGKLPELDAEVTRVDARLLDELLDRLETLEGALAPSVMTGRARSRLRVGRWARAVAVVALVLVGGYFALRTPRVLRAEATAIYSPRYAASNAVDGKAETEWVLPDRMQGTLTVYVTPARKVSKVRLLNIHNPPFNDRATKNYRVQVHHKGQVVKTLEGSFPEFTDLPAWKAFEVGVVADRVTLEVLSWHKDGGGIAEIDVD